MTTLNNYQVFCETDQTWETVWLEEPPTVCPTNVTHTIDTDTISILQVVSESIVSIKEELIPTGGFVQMSSRRMNITESANEQIFDFTMPININILSFSLRTTDDNNGDKMEIHVAPNTTIGAIIANVSIGDQTIYVSPTVLQNIKVGYFVKLTNNFVTRTELGRVLTINIATSSITVETASDAAYSALTPTYVQMSAHVMSEFEIGAPLDVKVGDDKIGSSFVPAGTVVRVCYLNRSGVAKSLVITTQYLY